MTTILCLWALLSGLAVEPSHRDAASTATLALSRDTSETLACWRYPALRGSFRRYAEWSRALREDGDSTATLARISEAVESGSDADRAAGLVALQDHFTTSVLTAEGLAAERKRAAAILERQRPWGGEALLVPLAQPRSIAHTGLIGYLIDQLGEDEVHGNAFSSAELLYTGLKADPERFFPPMLDALSAGSGKPIDQAETILANLVFTFALADAEYYATSAESWAVSSYDGMAEPERRQMARLSAVQRRAVLDAAVRAGNREAAWSVPREVSEYARFNRWMAWTLLEEADPLPEDQLRAIITDGDRANRDKRRALALFFLREPLALGDAINRDLYAETVASGEAFWSWRSRQLGAILRGDRYAWADLLEDVEHPIESFGDKDPVETAKGVAPALLASLAEMLAGEHSQKRQMNLADAIVGAEYEEAYDLAALASITNLANDDFPQNAARAVSVLEDLGAEAVIAAHAGLKVGAEVGDWQLIEMAASLLRQYDEDFDPAQYPEAMRVMAEQLRDDGVEGNAAAARRYLRRCSRDDLRRVLAPLLESDDEQARGIAGSLLN